MLLCILRRFLVDVENVATFKITLICNSKESAEYTGFIAEHSLYLVRCPDKELAFFAFAVGVRGRIETAFRPGHLPQNIVESFLGDATIHATSGSLMAV